MRDKIKVGMRFGMLTVLERSHRRKRRTFWVCRCDCGRETIAMAMKLHAGRKKSCGCQRGKRAQGVNVGRNHSRRSWEKMLERCYDPRHKSYRHYGERGIAVCEEWRNFEVFYTDMGDRPVGLTLGRIDNDRDYEPGNCRWETPYQQAANRRVTRYTMISGRRETLADACRRLGMPRSVVYGRLKAGWSEADAFSRPIRR